MCFSAAASFTVSGLLAGVGAVSLARNEVKALRMFAAVPVLFAIQQVSEGAVWLDLRDRGAGAQPGPAILAFLAFALVAWPIWLPLALRRAERQRRRRRALTAFVACGALVAAVAAFSVARGHPHVHIAGHSLSYDYSFPFRAPWFLPVLAYLVPTIGPFFVSSLGLSRTLGVALLIALAATVLVQRAALTSVWCFFAAILSALIALAVTRAQGAYAGAPRA